MSYVRAEWQKQLPGRQGPAPTPMYDRKSVCIDGSEFGPIGLCSLDVYMACVKFEYIVRDVNII
jgi:hypothetical protein